MTNEVTEEPIMLDEDLEPVDLPPAAAAGDQDPVDEARRTLAADAERRRREFCREVEALEHAYGVRVVMRIWIEAQGDRAIAKGKLHINDTRGGS